MIDLFGWWDKFAVALQHPAFHAAFMALVMGVALTEAAQWLMPASWHALTAERVARIIVAITITFAGYKMHPTTIGAGWSFTVGVMAPSMHHHLKQWAYNKWPHLRPKVFRPDVYDEPRQS